MTRGGGHRRRPPIAVREPLDIDVSARRLLGLVARLRAAQPTDALARAEVEFLASAIEATVKSTLARGVDAKVLLHELKRLLYAAEGAVETRIRSQPRGIATHVAVRRAVEREFREIRLL